jgi:RNA polymerase sigma factor (TIGR02999 family)
MDDRPVHLIAQIVARADDGDPVAKENLFAALYEELHRLAQAHLHRTGSDLALSPTTLLHEAYLDLAGRDGLAFPDHKRFLAYASRAMRRLIIDYVRHRDAQKRGGDVTFTSIENRMVPTPRGVDLEELGRALEELALLDAGLAQLVDLKFFCGFSFAEIAAMRGVSERTVQRDWAKARLLLHDWLHDD